MLEWRSFFRFDISTLIINKIFGFELISLVTALSRSCSQIVNICLPEFPFVDETKWSENFALNAALLGVIAQLTFKADFPFAP